ncbi:AAA family ATPase [Arthrobacter sp. L77]|uniref:AAA family ATPase n=1 Tax=Arthrobacter sp. L77 TaxID=1496689 RepID=UPI0005BCBB39|nr:AAA family ATPase [Arthrobacter sp. L77]
MSRYAVISTHPDILQRFQAAATGVLAGEVHAWQGASFPAEPQEVLAQLTHPVFLDVLVLGPGVPLERALHLATAFEVQRPEVAVLLVAPPTPDVVLAAMRAGIRDVVEPDADPDAISVLLHRAVRSAAIRRRSLDTGGETGTGGTTGRVIAVISPKGGAGKTTIASSLAIGLASSAPHGTVLVDLDLQFGDVASALAISPEHSVSDAVHGPARRDTMVLKSFLSAHPTGLYALCAPSSPDTAEQVTADDVTHLLEQLASQYRYVVVDTAPGLSDHTLAALDKASDFVFVTGTDVPSVRGMRKELDILSELGMYPLKRHLVLNAADARGGVSRQDVEAALGVEVDVIIPASRAVRLATNQGIPLTQRTGRDRASKAMRALVARFTAPAASTPSTRKGTARHRVGAP